MKILVVDDDDIALVVARKILENDHYEVVSADDGQTALDILRLGEIKIVVSDWNMPNVTGLDLCSQIRSFSSAGYIYIILVTARSSKEDMLEGLSAGADDFISKPFEPAELLVRVRNAERVLAMERDLRQSESRNAALLSAVPDSIFRIRRDGILLDYTAGSTEILDVDEDKIMGTMISAILPDSMLEDAMACIDKTLYSREIQTLEYTLKLGDSSHVFEARFKDSGPDEVTAIVRDISERARLDQMKSDFINRATHELR
ncbi:MAG: response regulator, partial [Chloroflexi bacterium]|nr:response regulator [Chloroflexota bacterium]